jgi:hypothetical protein
MENMASNSFDLSSELKELIQLSEVLYRTQPVIPTVEFFKNNKSGVDLAYTIIIIITQKKDVIMYVQLKNFMRH